jgi:hypothetical protein
VSSGVTTSGLFDRLNARAIVVALFAVMFGASIVAASVLPRAWDTPFVALVLGSVVWLDARQARMRFAWSWAVAAVFLPVIAWVLYARKRRTVSARARL